MRHTNHAALGLLKHINLALQANMVSELVSVSLLTRLLAGCLSVHTMVSKSKHESTST